MRAFVGPDDIVHALRQAIAILEAVTPPPDFSKQPALRWLVHLVGDLHQPFHVTTGYYDPNAAKFATKPARINAPAAAAVGGVLGDRGANRLLFSASESNNLHALWDAYRGWSRARRVQVLARNTHRSRWFSPRKRPQRSPSRQRRGTITPGRWRGLPNPCSKRSRARHTRHT